MGVKTYSHHCNCLKSDPYRVTNIVNSAPEIITCSEVCQAVALLPDKKACGLDHITAEHLKFAGPNIRWLYCLPFVFLDL